MYLGKIVEVADRDTLYSRPMHPYTNALVSAVPVPDPVRRDKAQRERILLVGDVPSPINPPSGCAFHTRCRYVMDRCKVERPVLAEAGVSHQVACWLNDGTGRSENS
jgi:peptide/nickel transport system ATP-binding protein/oligopeptide transport system ATP-binding protein